MIRDPDNFDELHICRDTVYTYTSLIPRGYIVSHVNV